MVRLRPTALALAVGMALAGCSSRAEKAENYYQHGTEYLKQKDFAKARVEFRNALQLKPDRADAWRGLAEVDEHDNNLQGLVQDLSRVTELDEKDVSSRVRLARLFLMGGAVERALKLTNAAVELNPHDAGTLALKATVLMRLKDTDGATGEANKALAIDPNNTDATLVLAAIQLRNGNATQALDILSHVPPKSQDSLGVLFLKGDAYQKLGQLQQVEAILRRLISLHPENPTFRQRLISFYVANDRKDDAERELRKYVEAHPDDQQAEMSLVGFLGQVRGVAAARTELSSRIAKGGKKFPFEIALAKLDFTQGQFDASKKLLTDLIDHSEAAENANVAKVTLAQMYLDRKDPSAAEPLITDVLSKDAGNTQALRLRAAIRLGRGQTDDAIADLRRALNDQPRSPELLASLAIAYERSGTIELADKSFQDAMKTSGYQTTYGLNYVAFLQRRGFTTQAQTVLGDLVSRHPKDVAILSALARDRIARQDWSSAHEIAGEIRQLGSAQVVADQIDGAAFAGQNKLNESVSALQDAYEASPNSAQSLAALVGTYLRNKQPQKAEDLIQSALKANPNNAEAIALLGSIKLSKGDAPGAEQDYRRAIKAQAQNPIGYSALAELYLRQGKQDQALETVKSGLKEQPKNFSLRLTLAGFMEMRKDYDAAIAEYDSMLKDNPGSLIVINNLASLLADHKTDKESLQKARNLAAALKSSQVPQFQDTLGWVDYQNGNYSAALASLEPAAQKLSGLPLVQYHLGMTYLAAGDQGKANEQFDKARKLAPTDRDLSAKIDDALKAAAAKQKS
jgi:Tfp pilus assembly protein PilF